MKKLLLVFMSLTIIGFALGAQSLEDNPDYKKSVELRKQSDAAFEKGDYAEAKRLADESRKYAERIAFDIPSMPKSEFPAAYVVRLLPGNTDCLWNIAGYDFVYGDPWEWSLLYEANRDIMPQRDNPDLIYPDMVLEIPSRNNEQRSGTWKNGVIQ